MFGIQSGLNTTLDSSFKYRIEIPDFSKLKNINVDTEVIAPQGGEKDLALDVNQLLNCSTPLELNDDAGTSFKFTFKSAVKLVVYVMNRALRLTYNNKKFLIVCPQMGGKLLAALKTMPIEGSANWLEAILKFLVEDKKIKKYELNGENYQVFLS